MMELQELMRMTLRGGGLILLACLLRALLGRRMPKWTIVLLWCAAILRLLAPFSVTVQVPGKWLADGSGGRWHSIPTAVQQAGGGEVSTVWLCWLVGCVFLALLLAGVCLYSHRRLREALPLRDAFCLEYVMRQHLRRRVRVQVSDRIATPLTCGVCRPRIILPKEMDCSRRDQLLCVLTHEMVHIRRMDVLIKLAALAALCIHWFNPLVWLMVFLLDRDLEKACDEKVISLLGEGHKRIYATALLDLAERKNRFSPLYSGFGQNGFEERIVSIMKYQKISRLTATAAALAVLAAAGASAAELKPKTETTPTVSYTAMKMKSAELEPGAALEAKSLEEMYGIYEKAGVVLHEDGSLWHGAQRVGSLVDRAAGLLYYDTLGAVHLEAVYEGDTLTGVRECEAPKVGQVALEESDAGTVSFQVTEPSQAAVGAVYTVTTSERK